VRASERRKGYATQMLKLALMLCADMGIRDVLLTCDKGNVASVGVITANGGVLTEEFTDDDGKLAQRYWIRVDEHTRPARMRIW
jgi:predicted acetyltransferase